MSTNSWQLLIEGRPDGSILAASLVLMRDDHCINFDVDKTVEVIPGTLLADYTSTGALLSVEILGPVAMESILRLDSSVEYLRFVQSALPESLRTHP